MFPRWIILAALLAVLSAPALCQDVQPQPAPEPQPKPLPQSLGEIARQLRAQRSVVQSTAVVTNDDVSFVSRAAAVKPVSAAPVVTSAPSVGVVLGFQKLSAPTNPATAGPAPDTDSSLHAVLNNVDLSVRRLSAMDPRTLLKLALQGGYREFPGHAEWEQRVLAAKQDYMAQGLDLVRQGKALLAVAETLKSAQASPDDPRMRQLDDNVGVFIHDSARADSAFSAVILEGRVIAKHTPVPAPPPPGPIPDLTPVIVDVPAPAPAKTPAPKR